MSSNLIQAERFIAKSVINNMQWSQSIDDNLVTNPTIKKIIKRVRSLYQRDGIISTESIKAHLSSLAGDNENAMQSINALCAQQDVDKHDFDTYKKILEKNHAKNIFTNILENGLSRAESDEDIDNLISIGSEILELKNLITQKKPIVKIGDAMDELSQQIAITREKGVEVGVPYSIGALRDHLYSMAPADLVVVAARPGEGKTALGLNLTDSCTEQDGMGVISSEMANIQLAMRYVSMETGISVKHLRNPTSLTDDQVSQINSAIAKTKGRNISLEDKGSINIAEIEAKAEEWVNICGVKVIIVDYVQRINSDKNHASPAERIGHITKRLKELAKRLDICVVLLAQLNRESVNDDRRPQVQDIKGCGDIEQEADVILLLYSPISDLANKKDYRIVEMIVGKNRAGEKGIILLRFIGNKMRFEPARSEDIELARNNYKAA